GSRSTARCAASTDPPSGPRSPGSNGGSVRRSGREPPPAPARRPSGRRSGAGREKRPEAGAGWRGLRASHELAGAEGDEGEAEREAQVERGIQRDPPQLGQRHGIEVDDAALEV